MNDNSIQVYKKRDFGELISTPIVFLVREFKKLFITLLVFVGPIIVLNLLLARTITSEFSQNIFNSFRYGSSGNPFEYITGGIILLYLVAILKTVVLYTVLAVYVKLYKIHGRDGFELQDIWNEFVKRIGNTLLAMFVGFFMILTGSFIFIIPGIYLAVVFYIFSAVIVFEEIPFGEAFSRVFQLMKGNWWISFGSFIILAIIAWLINVIISALLMGIFSVVGFGSTILLISSIVTSLVSLLITSVMGLLPVFLYTSFVDEKENPELMERINNISEEDEVNIFDVKESKSEDNVEDFTKKDDEPKTEDDWEKLLDEQEKKNRFEDDDKEDIDRFKPKY